LSRGLIGFYKPWPHWSRFSFYGGDMKEHLDADLRNVYKRLANRYEFKDWIALKPAEWKLSDNELAQFVNALQHPQEPNERLKSAVCRYKNLGF